MDNIIGLHQDTHEEAQLLLPWYVTGRLEAADLARVEAHLSTCSKCQAELKAERMLRAEISSLPMDIDQAWASMHRRIEAPRWRSPEVRSWSRAIGRGAPWMGWAAAAALVVVLLAGLPARQSGSPDRYRTLGTAVTKADGNVIVMFRPEATETAISQALKDSSARVVDGPTTADAFVLNVPAVERDSALVRLRAQAVVTLAEPIDPGGGRR